MAGSFIKAWRPLAIALALPACAWGQDAATGFPASGRPNGKPQTLAPHRPAHAAPRSFLAPAQLLPDVAKTYGGTPVDVTTYHYDNNRTGWNPSETDLTPATVASAKFGLLRSLAVDGNVFAQPLLITAFPMPDGKIHDVLIITTGHNSVYAYDAKTYALLWHVNLGAAQNSNDVGCGDVVPEYGISSTPVIVRTSASAATLYVVSATEPAPFEFHSFVHALSLTAGADVKPPVEIAPSAVLADGSTLTFDPQNQWSRAGLAYNNGSLYVGIGSHCDNNAYGISGWLLRYSTTLKYLHGFHTIETPHGYELASIWMTGFAPAIGPTGDVFVVTGNGDYTGAGAKDYGESVLRLSSLPSVKDRFEPAAYGALNNNDTDFGSGGVMLLPPVPGQIAPPMAVAIGKDAVLYLLDQNNLGLVKTHDAGALQSIRLGCSGCGVWGGPAYYDGPGGPTVFVQINGDVLRSFQVATGATPALTAGVSGTTGAGYGGSLPIISSNGAAAHTGVLWLIRRSDPIEIEAYDASGLGAPIFAADIGTWSNEGNGNPFLTPMEANGRVYAPGYRTVKVFGLSQ